MTRSRDTELLPFDPEIERACQRNRRLQRQSTSVSSNTMADLREEEAETRAETRADTRVLRDYAMPTVMDTLSGIRKPPIPANNFEIKPAIIHMVQANQFGGSPIEDPNAHIATFMEICDTFKHNGVSDDAIRLRLFPFSLRDKAKNWL